MFKIIRVDARFQAIFASYLYTNIRTREHRTSLYDQSIKMRRAKSLASNVGQHKRSEQVRLSDTNISIN
jgi:hypothetical protein